ncbi:MAG: hypothetical protein ACKOPS_22605, partial [Cyanobium sp.]
MNRWGKSLAAAALAVALSGAAQAKAPAPAGEASSAPAANPVLNAASAIGLPTGVLVAGGVLWLLFNQGKAFQENVEAWGKVARRLRGQAAQAGAGRRFAVGFCFAQADRALVAPIAELLAQRLTVKRVLFEPFLEAELARPEREEILRGLYRDQSELLVVVLGTDAASMGWLLEEARERVLLLRIGSPDLTALPLMGDGGPDISQRPPRATADLILERLVQLGVVTRPRGQGPVRAVALAAGAAAVLAGGWWLGRPQLARWQLQRGDDAWLAYAKQLDQRQLQKAAEAW